MATEQIIGIVIGVLGGGGVVGVISAISSHFIGKKKASAEMTGIINDGFSNLLTQQRGEMERVHAKMQILEDSLERRNKLLDEERAENVKLRQQIEKMEKDMAVMKRELELLRQVIQENGIKVPAFDTISDVEGEGSED